MKPFQEKCDVSYQFLQEAGAVVVIFADVWQINNMLVLLALPVFKVLCCDLFYFISNAQKWQQV